MGPFGPDWIMGLGLACVWLDNSIVLLMSIKIDKSRVDLELILDCGQVILRVCQAKTPPL